MLVPELVNFLNLMPSLFILYLLKVNVRMEVEMATGKDKSFSLQVTTSCAATPSAARAAARRRQRRRVSRQDFTGALALPRPEDTMAGRSG